MDKLITYLTKHYDELREEIIPNKNDCSEKKECPEENRLWRYIKDENNVIGDEIEEHLLSCSECLESLKSIKLIIEVEKSTENLPHKLHKAAKQILNKA